MDKLLEFLAQIFCQFDDECICILAIINIVVYFITRREINKANNLFNPRNDKVNGVSASMEWDGKQISELKKKRKTLLEYYTCYANFTAIFPLLGILGTVAALVTYSNETMMDNFMVALGTTLLGVFFAIIYKFIDASISAPLDLFFEDTDHVIQDYDRRKEARE